MAVQLFARGQQDIYITGKPSITYFSSKYRQNTPFFTEYIEQSFDNLYTPDSTMSLTIPKRGDILSGISLKLIFPALYTYNIPGIYCFPTLSTNTRQVYAMPGNVLVLQFAPYTTYYSTYNINYWATATSTITMSYDSVNNKFNFTDTGSYTSIYFIDESSASFCGFDISNPSYTINSLYSAFNLVNGTVSSQLTLTQSGWVNGYVPRISNEGWNYTSNYATKIIKEARLFIGGQLINRISGNYIRIKNDYDTTYENQSGRTALEGTNDTSIKYKDTTSIVNLPFDIENIPLCSIYRQDLRLEVELGSLSNLIPSTITGSGSLSDSNSYSLLNLREAYNIGNLVVNSTFINGYNLYLNHAGTNRTQYNTTTSSYTYGVNNSGFTSGFTRCGNYAYVINGIYLKRILISDIENGVNSSVTSSVMFHPYAVADTTGNWGSTLYTVSSLLSADSRYIYIQLATSLIYFSAYGRWAGVISINSSGGNTWWTITFYGTNETISPFTGIGAAVRAFVNRNTTFLTTSLRNQRIDGNNVLVEWFSAIYTSQSLENNVVNLITVRYDTNGDFNASSSYSAYTNIYGNFYNLFPSVSMPYYNSTVVNNYSDGRYLNTEVNGYLYIIDMTKFMSTSGYVIYDKIPIGLNGAKLTTPWVSDGTWLYTSFDYTYSGTSFYRLKIGNPAVNGIGAIVLDTATAIIWNTINPNGLLTYSPAAGFDGRYVYWTGATTAASPIMFRYDTTKSFTYFIYSCDWISKHWSYRNNPYASTATGFDSNGGNIFNRMKVDSAGNFYVIVYSPSSYTVYNSDGTTYGTPYTGYLIIKYNTTGIVQWVVNSSNVYFKRLNIDSTGNIYVTGTSVSQTATVTNATGSTYTVSMPAGCGQSGDMITIKISPAGTCLWNIYSWTRNDLGIYYSIPTGLDVAFDASDNLYVLANAPGQILNGGSNYSNIYSAGSSTVFKQIVSATISSATYIAKVSPAGVIQWVSYVLYINNNDGNGYGAAIKVKSDGTVVVTGTYAGTQTFLQTCIAYDAAGNSVLSIYGQRGSFLLTLNTSGTPTNFISLVTTGGSQPAGNIVIDGSDNIITGLYNGGNSYIYKYNSSTFAVLWTITLSGTGTENIPHITQDSSGNIIAHVASNSPVLSVADAVGGVQKYTIKPFSFNATVYKDTFILKFTTNGAFLSGTQCSGSVDDIPYGLDVDSSGNIYSYIGYSSIDLNIAGTSFANTSSPTGDLYGASKYLFFKISATTGKIVTSVTQTNINGGLDDNFVTNNGNLSVNVGYASSWSLVQSPRYFYLVSSTSTLLRYDPFSGYSVSLKSASMLFEYMHISQAEREYLIKTPIYISFRQIQTTTSSSLPFLGPIDTLYMSTTSNVSNFILVFNGQELFNLGKTYFQMIVPYDYSACIGYDNSYMYKFPSPVNFSRISEKILTADVGQPTVYAQSLNVACVKNGLIGLLFNSLY
jgi:hypothetical protein